MIPMLQQGQFGRTVAVGGDASGGYLSPFYPTTLYSLRLRKSGYAGACIRVKRSSDSTQTDIGFGPDGWLDTSSLMSFVGAGNGFVKTWYDQSGGGVDLTDSGTSDSVLIVSGGTLQTLNSKPALKFSATPSRLIASANAAFAFGTAAWTWETFLYNTSDNATGQVIIDFRDAGSAIALHYHANANLNTFFDGANANAGSADVTFLSATHEAVSYVGGASSALRIFGGGTQKHSVNKTLSFSGNRPIAVGCGYNAGLPWQGLMTEIRITKGTCQYTASFTAPNYYA